jgi:hypothetical protein
VGAAFHPFTQQIRHPLQPQSAQSSARQFPAFKLQRERVKIRKQKSGREKTAAEDSAKFTKSFYQELLQGGGDLRRERFAAVFTNC